MARRRHSGAPTPAVVALERAGVEHTLHPYEHDPAAGSFGLEAAGALGLPPGQVFKTLLAQADGELVVGLVPVDARLDLKALATAVGARRVVLAEPADAERSTGYVVGGISPLGQRKRLRTVVDRTALDHDRVYVSAGRRGLDVGVAPRDLVRVLDARLAAISRW